MENILQDFTLALGSFPLSFYITKVHKIFHISKYQMIIYKNLT